ncbi:hypothetical protein C8R45DRAFT_974395 [Mycena sanguinolenta]|nr:hypothetical protein C8R45DRAFT_974395 [Mycena sanguinolenta]
MPPSGVRSYIARHLLAAFKSTMLIALAFLVPQLVLVSVFPAPRLRCGVCLRTATLDSYFHSVHIPANRSFLVRLRLLRAPHSALARNGWQRHSGGPLHDSSVARAARPSSSFSPSSHGHQPHMRPLRYLRKLFLSVNCSSLRTVPSRSAARGGASASSSVAPRQSSNPRSPAPQLDSVVLELWTDLSRCRRKDLSGGRQRGSQGRGSGKLKAWVTDLTATMEERRLRWKSVSNTGEMET